jgi:predicted regulator of Ras-like GTPase activity (Roadblock/LC7/MglB family)
MALEGTLEEFNIVAVLQMIASGGMTGTLTVRDPTNTKATVSFDGGSIIHARSPHLEDRLGEILVHTRRITRPQLDKATNIQIRQEPGKRLGQILIDAGMITREDLVMAVQIQILEVMSQLLLWARGQWRFDFGAPDPGSVTPDEALTVDEILSGQVLMLETVEPSIDRSEAYNAVYAMTPGKSLNMARITLERDHWQVLSAIDGHSSIQEISSRIGMDTEQVVEIAADLVQMGLLIKQEPRVDETGARIYPTPPAAQPRPSPALDTLPTVVDPATLERINDLLGTLLLRTEAHETCLIDSSGSLITRRGREMQQSYHTLFALAASIFASWQELGRSLGESRASTLLYQGEQLNICLTPVGQRAILMTLYQSASDSGLVNFWSREASGRILRLLNAAAAAPGADAPGAPAPAPGLPSDYRDDAERAMDDLLAPHPGPDPAR